MTQAITTTAAQHLSPVAEMRAQLEYVAQFVRDKGYKDDFARDASLMLRTTERGYKGKWTPDVPQLCNALIYLAAIGVSLNPVRQESALICFGNQVKPDVMKNGLVRIAAEMYPIVSTTEQVVMAGDLWQYAETETGPRMLWEPSDSRAVLTSMSDLAPVTGAWCRVDFFDARTGREWHITGALVGDDLREKLRANTNARSGGGAWGQHKIAMIEKTVLRYTLQHKIPLSGDPALSLRLTAESQSNSRALLTEYAAQRGLALPEGVDAPPASSTRQLIDAAPEIPDREPRTVRDIRDEILACTDSGRLDALEDEIAGCDAAGRNYLDNVLADRRAKLEEK